MKSFLGAVLGVAFGAFVLFALIFPGFSFNGVANTGHNSPLYSSAPQNVNVQSSSSTSGNQFALMPSTSPSNPVGTGIILLVIISLGAIAVSFVTRHIVSKRVTT